MPFSLLAWVVSYGGAGWGPLAPPPPGRTSLEEATRPPAPANTFSAHSKLHLWASVVLCGHSVFSGVDSCVHGTSLTILVFSGIFRLLSSSCTFLEWGFFSALGRFCSVSYLERFFRIRI